MHHTLITKDEIQKIGMLNPLKSTLLNLFPAHEGWKLYNRYNWSSKVYNFVMQKDTLNHQVERIVIEVNFENYISHLHFAKLDALAERLRTDNCSSFTEVDDC